MIIFWISVGSFLAMEKEGRGWEKGRRRKGEGGWKKGRGGALDLRLSTSFIGHIKSGIGFTFCVIRVLSGE